MSSFLNDAIFWIEVDKIKPNPYQPRREFDEDRLGDLADSIRQYGVLQPLIVTRREVLKDDGGLVAEYELISGERRLRASKLAGVREVPVIIKSGSDDARIKLELAIIENLQREDLNPVDRARAFRRLLDDFHYKHSEIADKIGKSREYVSNTLRILTLPQEILDSVSAGKISEGHTRPLLMLEDKPEEQETLFKEIIYKKLTVREAEAISRRIAFERARRRDRSPDPETIELERKLTETLGTRVQIERGPKGGKIHIDFFSPDDLRSIISLVSSGRNAAADPPESPPAGVENPDGGGSAPSAESPAAPAAETPKEPAVAAVSSAAGSAASSGPETAPEEEAPIDDRSIEEKKDGAEPDDLYSVKNFTV